MEKTPRLPNCDFWPRLPVPRLAIQSWRFQRWLKEISIRFDMIVRRARLDDAKAIARIHVHAWQSAYQGIVPSAFLNSLRIDDREQIW